MKPYIYQGELPQFVTLNGVEYALHPQAPIELPDCDYVQTLVAKKLLVAVPVKPVKKGGTDNAS